MKAFTDNTGVDWPVRINLGTAKRLREQGINLFDIEKINELISDPIDLFNLMFLVIEPLAKERGISDEQFGERLAGVGERATDAFMEELIDFFLEAGRPAAAEMIRKVWKAAKMAQTRAMGIMEDGGKLDQTIQNLIDKSLAEAERNLDQLSGETSTKSAAS